MNQTWQNFRKLTQGLADLEATISILAWDQETTMPSKGAANRASQRATAAALHHEKLTDPKLSDLIKRLLDTNLNSWERRSVEEMSRIQRKALCLPRELVEDLARTAATAYESWLKSRHDSDFEQFAPWLEKILSLKREEARYLKVSDSLYESLLDEYEPGMKEPVLEEIFGTLRPHLTSLLKQITHSPVHARIRRLEGVYPIETQELFGRDILTAMGFDWEAGRLDKSPHPFCTGFSPEDVRITTRYSKADFSGALFGIIHEGGHALYEQGLDPTHYGLPICEAISLGIHESQSRLWENQVGRSKSFWRFWLPRLKEVFPGQLEGISLQQFILSVNLVEPSLVRVTADEVTYGLHIILRFELERALLNEELDVRGLPTEWNQRMVSYLGIRPENDAEGVLQDVHWSHGLIGYFPTYLLGNLYAAQLMSQAAQDIPELDDQIVLGQLKPLREWLLTNVHRMGKIHSAEEMILRVTGESLNPEYFLRYLETKFGELYEL
jgi:carboxypeptidase Taq